MSAILLVDDNERILESTASQLKLSGHDVDYVTDYKQAANYLRLNRPNVNIVVITLNNSLGYPSLRKIKSLIHQQTTLIIYSKNHETSLKDWTIKLGIEHFFEHPNQEIDLYNRIKRSLFRRGMFFTHQQLSSLTVTLAKYTDGADVLVKEIAPKSKSLQELQHKLARRLPGIEVQRKFLAEVQR